MALKASLSSDVNDKSKWIGSVDGNSIPIVTQHSSSGTSETISVYIFNDGKRDSDADETYNFEYHDVYIKPKGKRTRILTTLGDDVATFNNTIPVEDPRYYNSGTKLITDPILIGGKAVTEEMWIKSVQGNNLIVDRGQNNTTPITIKNRTWIEAKPDHIYLSLSGAENSWVQGKDLKLPDISDEWSPVKVYVRVMTGALKTQVKMDSLLQIAANEYPKIIL